jgi:hypothetical protein
VRRERENEKGRKKERGKEKKAEERMVKSPELAIPEASLPLESVITRANTFPLYVLESDFCHLQPKSPEEKGTFSVVPTWKNHFS